MTLEDLQKKFETQAAVAELLKMLRPNTEQPAALPAKPRHPEPHQSLSAEREWDWDKVGRPGPLWRAAMRPGCCHAGRLVIGSQAMPPGRAGGRWGGCHLTRSCHPDCNGGGTAQDGGAGPAGVATARRRPKGKQVKGSSERKKDRTRYERYMDVEVGALEGVGVGGLRAATGCSVGICGRGVGVRVAR
jgi:hypothetical protein